MKLLLVSHSCDKGGAQTGLTTLAKALLNEGHNCSVLFASPSGDLIGEFNSMGVECLYMPFPWALPVPSNALLELCRPEIELASAELKEKQFDAIITNTVTQIQGAEIAHRLSLPHFIYTHELLNQDPALRPRGCSTKDYLQLLNSRTAGWIACSGVAAEELLSSGINRSDLIIFHPISPTAITSKKPNTQTPSKFRNLILIGEQSKRKNFSFAITVANALIKRRHNIKLHHYGIPGSETAPIHRAVQRFGLEDHIIFHGHRPNPAQQIPDASIHLITATSEAFGLTIAECIGHNIPVVSSKCGGPEELLHNEALYEINNLEECIYRLESLLNDSPTVERFLLTQSTNLGHAMRKHASPSEVSSFLKEKVRLHNTSTKRNIDFGQQRKWELSSLGVPANTSLSEISAIIQPLSGLSTNEWRSQLREEGLRPGTACNTELQKMNIPCHADSKKLESLYHSSHAFLLELTSAFADKSRARMSQFVLHHCLCKFEEKSRILAVGDGLGFESIGLAAAGFHVDYQDSWGSKTHTGAQALAKHFLSSTVLPNINFTTPGKHLQAYQAIVCLEVIEHVSQPQAFLSEMAEQLAPGGTLIISESFGGVEPRWPTHLHSNIHFSGRLPLLCAEQGLELVDFNKEPIFKPYIFRKCKPGEMPRWGESLLHCNINDIPAHGV